MSRRRRRNTAVATRPRRGGNRLDPDQYRTRGPWGTSNLWRLGIQATLGQAVPPADIAPGDVIACALSGGGDLDHIGLYIGDGQMIAVRIEPAITGVPVAVRSFG